MFLFVAIVVIVPMLGQIYLYKNLLILVLDKNTKGFIYGFKYELCIDLHIIAACALEFWTC